MWLVTYTSNIYIFAADRWIGRLGHFWTLAVEEQFYLVWPWLVLFARGPWVVASVVVLMSLAPIYRWYVYAAFPFDVGAMDFKAATFTIASPDTLARGRSWPSCGARISAETCSNGTSVGSWRRLD